MKIFLSSTILDLRDLRDTLVKELSADGHEVIASEKGTVLLTPGKHSYEQCLAGVVNCDCLISVIDGRFGGEYPPGSNKSITEAEIEVALELSKQTLVFVRQSVWDSLANQKEYVKDGANYKPIKNIVEDIRVFGTIDRIRKKPKDNWIFQFNFPTDLLSQIRAQIGVSGTAINWLDRSHQLLTAQKHLTTNGLFNNSDRNHNLDDIHVPLGLIERKERPKVKEEPSPEQGSQLYQTEYTETKRFEHEAFLAEVVGNRVAGKHIAIIGEPGAGKTTILTKIGEYLIQQAQQQPEQAFVVAWVSLAAVGDRPLQIYLQDEWLQKVCEDDFDVAWGEWRELRQQGRVWLLLDGLDEMSGDALGSIYRDLGQAWAQNLRVVMTCRINQWEAAAGGNILTNSFDVYRTLDYSYQTSQGEDQVEKFISNWFGDKDKEVAKQIRRELDAAGKERIKDLVKNPLRLTLLCAAWEQDNQALPETQAELYRGFVNYLYGWKAREFKEEVKLKDELNLALGELAKAGLNRASINDGAVRRFRFTASEIRKLWQDLPDTLLPAAKNLGWLNVVGKEKKEDLYAFYHPTFQEYFAACSINDWDYFLPRAHVDRPIHCQGESVPYRVFEQEWRQVILLWIGRRKKDITDECKEQFIDKLNNFQEQEGDFYYYRAFCMAAICVGEFRSSRQAEAIVQQIVTWGFGYFNSEKQKWINYLEPLSQLAKETVYFTHRGYGIAVLIGLLGDSNPDNTWLDRVAWALGEIAVANPMAITALIELLGDSNLDNRRRNRVAGALGKIAVANPMAITALIELLGDSNLDNLLQCVVMRTLCTIDSGNPTAITVLIERLGDSNLDNDLRCNVVEALGKIAVGNPKAIAALIALLGESTIDNKLRYGAAEALGRIAVGNSTAITALITLLEDSNLDNDRRYGVAEALSKIAVWNPTVIAALILMLGDSSLDNWLRYKVVEMLGQIAVWNPKAITAFIELLGDSNDDYYMRFMMIKKLGQIEAMNPMAITALIAAIPNSEPIHALSAPGNLEFGIAALIELLADCDHDIRNRVIEAFGETAVGNQKAITVLIELLGDSNLYNGLRYGVAEALGEIAVGNQKAIALLIELLGDSNLDNGLRYGVAEALGKIITKETMPLSILQLKNNVTNEVSKSNFRQYKACREILFKCAQTLSYPEFHAAWHQTTDLPILRQAQGIAIPFSPQTLHPQLNRPHTPILDITTLNNHTTPELAQTLSNHIHTYLNTQPIPQIQNIPQLTSTILNLQPHLALILYHPTPTPTLIQEIAKLHHPKQIQIIWITNAPIPDALSPDSENLAAAILAAIDRFTDC